MPTPEKKSKPG
jgi:hypothetical protein